MELQQTHKASVTLTPAAVRQVKYLIAKRGQPGLGLRLAVRGGGCSGFSYVLGLQPEPNPGDHVVDAGGVRVFVDARSARFLDGVTVDYSLKNLMSGGFTFKNPNAARSCGCGTSFAPKMGGGSPLHPNSEGEE
ncbi:MAG: HesB/IscA family protein [Chthonomonadales bacterium]